MFKKIRELVIGKRRDLNDPAIFHSMALVAVLAWVGLGADGLSSSAYGPEEAFRALGEHRYLAVFLALMTAVTVAVISMAYSQVIKLFPGGGGGYLVATKLLGEKAGVVSGAALVVDYVLTIAVSIASGCDALFSFMPQYLHYKYPAEFVILALLVIMNLRGVKESVILLAPIFLIFLVTHALTIVYAITSHMTEIPGILHSASVDVQDSVASGTGWVTLFLLLRAYSLGAGTYTGIEAVSNGMSLLREPKVKTGQRTMLLMAVSLAVTAGGILFAYMLTGTNHVAGKTMNAVLLENLFGGWSIGPALIIVTLISEAVLLFVAAQAGLLGGPRVLSNMANDSWVPHRFAQLSERLVTNNGIYLMGLFAAAALMYTRGGISTLVIMYSINVFITFVLTELGMLRHWWRTPEIGRKRQLVLHGVGLLMCSSILAVTLVEKFTVGGWVTILVTGGLIFVCVLIRSHYRAAREGLKRLDDILTATPMPDKMPAEPQPIERKFPVAVITVSSFSGFGLHQILSIQKLFPNYFKQFIFVSVGVVDSGNFKGAEEIEKLEEKTKAEMERYVEWCRHHGLRAESRIRIDNEVIVTVEAICREIAHEYPRSIFFGGKLIFQKEMWYHRFLHNETPFAIQRRLQFDGIQMIILPIRVL